jgi:lipopolysaccharide biosynthesis glycosyltransferase
MYWFSGLNDNIDNYKKLYRVAARSVLLNTTLIPILIYDGTDTEFIANIENDGITVIHHAFSCVDTPAFKARHPSWKKIAAGTYLRIDVPIICKMLGITDPYVLYTDADVIFVADVVQDMSQMMPEYFAVCREANATDEQMNAGVLVLNRSKMLQTHSDFLAFIDANYNDQYDQYAYQTFYANKYVWMDTKFNHRPYWGLTNASIIHYHGPKPYDIQEYIEKNEVRKIYSSIYASVDKSVWKAYYAKFYDICKMIPKFRFNTEIDSNFDWRIYLENYDDIRESGISTQASASAHWKLIGCDEGRTDKPLFNWRTYLFNYPDLGEHGITTKEGALKHWRSTGKAEGRTDACSLNWQIYLRNYPDLKMITTKEEAIDHWITCGKVEGRVDTPLFDYAMYLFNYPDLVASGITAETAQEHWESTGKAEGRTDVCLLNWQTYLSNYPDLTAAGIDTKEAAIHHWVTCGRAENRIDTPLYTTIPSNNTPSKVATPSDTLPSDTLPSDTLPSDTLPTDTLPSETDPSDTLPSEVAPPDVKKPIAPVKKSIAFKKSVVRYSYNDMIDEDMINEFNKHYPTAKLTNPKEEFRYLCFRYLKYSRLFPIPELFRVRQTEVVLIEYRKFPHLEFILRNAIHKLGASCSYTIVCGKLNYDYLKDIARSIHPNINIIFTPYSNLKPSTYSNLLASRDFWDNLNGDKILIMQEDTIIFRNNLDEFLEWDYIGAPWPTQQGDTPNSVGNGGFSLRTRQTMIDVIEQIPIMDTPLPRHTASYMSNSGNTILPEDVYFSKNIQEFELGRVAPWDIASTFSTESHYNPNSFGGHNFWVSDPNWRERVHVNTIIQFKCNTAMKLTHRGGWGSVLRTLKNYSVLEDSASNYFLSMVDEVYLWKQHHLRPTGPWCGVVHCTPSTTPAFKLCNLSIMIKNEIFLEDLKTCMVLFTLSEYISTYLRENIPNPPKIVTLFHPIEPCDAMFTMDKYMANPDKHLIQIGQQLRIVSSIFKIRPKGFKRLWLTGNPDMKRCMELLRCEYNGPVEPGMVYYTETYEEYDSLLEKNIVFIDLYDSAANNTVLECIIRNTPIIVNRTPGVVEYLGSEYPLYFNTLDEVSGLLKLKKLQSAHDYLCAMDKSRFTMDHFAKSIIAAVFK